MLLRRGALLFLKAYPSNFKFRRLKNSRFWPKLGVSGLLIQFEFIDVYTMMHRRGALLFFKVIRQISRSHRTTNFQFWPELSISGLVLRFEFPDGLEMMHKAKCSIEEVPYCFARSSIKFQGHMGQKIIDFDPNWAFPDSNSSLNSPRSLRYCAKLDVV